MKTLIVGMGYVSTTIPLLGCALYMTIVLSVVLYLVRMHNIRPVVIISRIVQLCDRDAFCCGLDFLYENWNFLQTH